MSKPKQVTFGIVNSVVTNKHRLMKNSYGSVKLQQKVANYDGNKFWDTWVDV